MISFSYNTLKTSPKPPWPNLLSLENLFVEISIVAKSNCKDSMVMLILFCSGWALYVVFFTLLHMNE